MATLLKDDAPRPRYVWAGGRMAWDVVLSSGYLAFARQIGFLEAIEASGLAVDGLCGTSSGAMVGALWAAGHRAERIAHEVPRPPMSALRLSWRPWEGFLDQREMLRRLKSLLPAQFSELERPFAVGCMSMAGEPVLLHSGALPEAVAASCAIPWLFRPVLVDGVPTLDGGPRDRTFIRPFRAWRGQRPTLVHLVERSIGAKNPPELGDLPVVHSPRSKAGLFNLGPFEDERRVSRQAAEAVLEGLVSLPDETSLRLEAGDRTSLR
jgi:predicted acylesterase/phospholipase RssA